MGFYKATDFGMVSRGEVSFYKAIDSEGTIGFQDFGMGSGGEMGFGFGRVQEVEWVLKL